MNKEGNKKSGARPTSSRPSSNSVKPAMQKKRAQGPKKVKVKLKLQK
jgi:23S rRNA pseudouridine2605 synthase